LGFATEGIPSVWPETGRRRSHNFWIRWDAEQERYLLSLRVGTSVPAPVASYALGDTRIDYMTKRLVMGKRIRIRAVRKKRPWFF